VAIALTQLTRIQNPFGRSKLTSSKNRAPQPPCCRLCANALMREDSARLGRRPYCLPPRAQWHHQLDSSQPWANHNPDRELCQRPCASRAQLLRSKSAHSITIAFRRGCSWRRADFGNVCLLIARSRSKSSNRMGSAVCRWRSFVWDVLFTFWDSGLRALNGLQNPLRLNCLGFFASVTISSR
jgi:hypothetical protein